MKRLLVFVFAVALFNISYSQCMLYGKIRIVEFDEDVKVRVIDEADYMGNLKVKLEDYSTLTKLKSNEFSGVSVALIRLPEYDECVSSILK